jgi:hypothetical protein
MKCWSVFLFSFFSFNALFGQKITQTVRGSVIDQDSQSSLPGANVVVAGSTPAIGVVTDEEGNFRLTQVPVGRITLVVTFMGYEPKTIPNILVTAGKEEIVTIQLAESVNTLESITIEAATTKGEIQNEMALISAHTFSVEETKRYAGSFDDPARMVSTFAGVNGDAEGNNDIIVRGNSPKGIVWRLEGIAIPNPNHFAGEGSTGGPINALSSKMLGNSDFFTGAFSAEYGDATSGVFDMKLKNGNNEQREYTAAVSTLGIDVTAEGPFKKGSRASYLANYRYSALDLLDKAGVVDFGGVPRYQDISFKLQLRLNEQHNFSLFGLGGMSGIDTEETDERDEDVITGKFHGRNKMGVLGISHIYQVNESAYFRSALALTGTANQFSFVIPDGSRNFYEIERGDISKWSAIGSAALNYKIDAENKIEAGLIITRLNFDLDASGWDADREMLTGELSDRGQSSTLQAFSNWKHRIGESLTILSGLHYLRFNLNGRYSIEPRLAASWQLDDRNQINAGVGLHSKVEAISTYLASYRDTDGNRIQPNVGLGLTKAAHFILGYDRQITSSAHIKLETYYQHLYDVPVENSQTTSYSILNSTEGYTTRDLINEGTGRNYGLELTVERYLSGGFYYLGTLSLFRSLYTPLNGMERASAFDNNYVSNLVGGKEFRAGHPSKNRVVFVNTKVALIGGKRYSPIDLEASIAAGEEVSDELHPFSRKGDDIFRTDFSVGVRRNRKHATTEFKIDVQNILNNRTVLGEDYIRATGTIYKARQLGMLPTISYRISF